MVRPILVLMLLTPLLATVPASADEDESTLHAPNLAGHPCYVYAGADVELWVEDNGIDGLQRHHTPRPDQHTPIAAFPLACYGNDPANIPPYVTACVERLVGSVPPDPGAPLFGLDVCFLVAVLKSPFILEYYDYREEQPLCQVIIC